MRTITFRGAVACALLMMAACTKNDDTKTSDPDNNGGGNSDTTVVVNPDPSKTRLVAVHTDGRSSFDSLTYKDGKLTRFASIDTKVSSVPFYEERYAYGVNNMVSQVMSYYDNVVDMKDSIVYVSGKKVVMYTSPDNDTTSISLNDNGQVQEVFVQNGAFMWRQEYTYTGKNLTAFFSTRTDRDGVVTTTEYIIKYDNKINPVYEIARSNFRYSPVWNSPVFFNWGDLKDMAAYHTVDSYNNPSMIKFLQYRDGVFTLDVNINYTYEYDGEGYPVKQVVESKGAMNGAMSDGYEVFDERVHRFSYGK